MLEKPIDELIEADVRALVARAATEGRHLEFKRDLPPRSDDGTREFLADVTAFANAQGGDLVFGVEDREGIASGVPGVQLKDVDAEILRMENLLRDAVDPRLSGVRITWIPLGNSTDHGTLILRIPASVTAPHRMKFKRSSRFYARNSRGKYEMDTHELRQAFTANEALPHRIRALHAEAVRAASGIDMPFRLMTGPCAITSVIPWGYFREVRDLDVTPSNAVVPVRTTDGFGYYETLEGVLLHSHADDENAVRAYTLLHRTGRFDAAWLVGSEHDGVKSVHPERFEKGLADMVRSPVTRLRSLGVEGPWVILTTIAGIRDYQIHVSKWDASSPAWRDSGTLPELILDDITLDALVPAFEAFWLLFGVRRLAT